MAATVMDLLAAVEPKAVLREHLEIGIDSLVELRDSGESVKHLRFA